MQPLSKWIYSIQGECLCVCVCTIYSLLIALNVHGSNLETLIKCYYQPKHFHLLSFCYETFTSVYIPMCPDLWVKENWVGMGVKCVRVCAHGCVCARVYNMWWVRSNALPLYAVSATIWSGLWGAQDSLTRMSHKLCYFWSNALRSSCGFWVDK